MANLPRSVFTLPLDSNYTLNVINLYHMFRLILTEKIRTRFIPILYGGFLD